MDMDKSRRRTRRCIVLPTYRNDKFVEEKRRASSGSQQHTINGYDVCVGRWAAAADGQRLCYGGWAATAEGQQLRAEAEDEHRLYLYGQAHGQTHERFIQRHSRLVASKYPRSVSASPPSRPTLSFPSSMMTSEQHPYGNADRMGHGKPPEHNKPLILTARRRRNSDANATAPGATTR